MKSSKRTKEWYIETEHGRLEQGPVDVEQAYYLAEFLMRNGHKNVRVVKGQRTLFDLEEKNKKNP